MPASTRKQTIPMHQPIVVDEDIDVISDEDEAQTFTPSPPPPSTNSNRLLPKANKHKQATPLEPRQQPVVIVSANTSSMSSKPNSASRSQQQRKRTINKTAKDTSGSESDHRSSVAAAAQGLQLQHNQRSHGTRSSSVLHSTEPCSDQTYAQNVYAPEQQSYAFYPEYAASGPATPGPVQTEQRYSVVQHQPGQHLHPHHQQPQSPGNSSNDANDCNISSTTRASPATIQWLLQNYETAEGVSLPRCTLYNHYLRHCDENRLDPVNAASFGKLIRSVFLGLRTRRLGTRGNSKYHYYGIRIQPQSPLNRLTDEYMARDQHLNNRHQPRRGGRQSQGGGSAAYNCSSNSLGDSRLSQQQHGQASYQAAPQATQQNNNPAQLSTRTSYLAQPQVDEKYVQFMHHFGMGDVPQVTLEVDGLESVLSALGHTKMQARLFADKYRQHCEDILELVRTVHLADVEGCWGNFWQPESEDSSEGLNSSVDSLSSLELSQSQLFSLCSVPQIQQYVQMMDFKFYQVLVEVLMPNVLKSIPSELIQIIRNFAKGLERNLGVAMDGAPEPMLNIKLCAVKSLAQTLRRYTSLNHLAQAARHVLENSTQITQMAADLDRVDFQNVQEQATWVCHCDHKLVQSLEKDFKDNLHKQQPLESWAVWLEAVVDQMLAQYHDRPLPALAHAAKQFLLKWSFYCSMIIRDLTLRSAASFGSFHLIRLLYDEYMFYLVEQRLARRYGQTTIGVMAQQQEHLLDDIMVGAGIEPSISAAGPNTNAGAATLNEFSFESSVPSGAQGQEGARVVTATFYAEDTGTGNGQSLAAAVDANSFVNEQYVNANDRAQDNGFGGSTSNGAPCKRPKMEHSTGLAEGPIC